MVTVGDEMDLFMITIDDKVGHFPFAAGECNKCATGLWLVIQMIIAVAIRKNNQALVIGRPGGRPAGAITVTVVRTVMDLALAGCHVVHKNVALLYKEISVVNKQGGTVGGPAISPDLVFGVFCVEPAYLTI